MAPFKNILENAIKKKIIQKIVMAIVGSTTGGLAWVVGFIVEFAWDNIAIPVINLGKRKGLLILDKQDGQIKALKMKEAVKNHDEAAYDKLIDGA